MIHCSSIENTERCLGHDNVVLLALPDSSCDLVGAERLRALRGIAHSALEHSAHLGGYAFCRPEKDSYGVPQSSRGSYWSISYAHDMVAAVVAPEPVGIDLERIEAVSELLKNRIASKKEWALISNVSSKWFYTFWTAKEAVLKATGKGLSGLDHCRIDKIVDRDNIQVHFNDQLWNVSLMRVMKSRSSRPTQYIAAITRGCRDIKWHVLDN